MTSPRTSAEAVSLADTDGSGVYWASSSCGRIEIALALEDARYGSHQGACDDDVAALLTVPYIQEQLAAVDAEDLKEHLSEYGAWNDDELQNHDTNLTRALWLFCGDLREEHIEPTLTSAQAMRDKLKDQISNGQDV